MNDFQTMNEIINESIRNSSYITVAISSGVFICYTLIVQLISYFKQRDKNKPLIEMATAIKENTANIVKLNTVLDKIFKDAERKEAHKCKNTIDLGFKTFGAAITQKIESIIIHNNIEKNRQLILDNITKLVSTEYYKLYAILSDYEINETNVARRLKEEWIDELTKTIIDIVYDGQDSISRITQINNRIGIYVSNFSTYISNKTFNA